MHPKDEFKGAPSRISIMHTHTHTHEGGKASKGITDEEISPTTIEEEDLAKEVLQNLKKCSRKWTQLACPIVSLITYS